MLNKLEVVIYQTGKNKSFTFQEHRLNYLPLVDHPPPTFILHSMYYNCYPRYGAESSVKWISDIGITLTLELFSRDSDSACTTQELIHGIL